MDAKTRKKQSDDYYRNYRKEHKTKLAAYQKKYYKKHKKEIAEKAKEYNLKNKEKVRKANRKQYEKVRNTAKYKKENRLNAMRWRTKNPEKYKELMRIANKKWRDTHHDDYQAYSAKRGLKAALKQRKDTVEKLLVGELEPYQQRVLDVISNTKTFNTGMKMESWVWGGLIYVLITGEGKTPKKAIGYMRTVLHLKGKNKYRRFLRAYRMLKDINTTIENNI
jgi:flagellar biosynthesis GTPase FlhF